MTTFPTYGYSGVVVGKNVWKSKMSDQERLDEMAAQDRVWKQRRMKSGHGAQDGSARDPNYKALIVVIAGPIKHWWDENWMTPEHLRYVEWRDKVEQECIAAGFLVYKPYSAFKGTWNEEAQKINNAVISVADILLVLTPEGVPSEGTDEEKIVAKKVGTTILEYPSQSPDGDESDLKVLVGMLKGFADKKNS